mmetsp:Transcript_7006/g.11708  ORF Transcript_7006/g.11708 Transcript_7006/m.11708 type:complete len:87 (-) Transcript_7006:803-1063(-)
MKNSFFFFFFLSFSFETLRAHNRNRYNSSSRNSAFDWTVLDCAWLHMTRPDQTTVYYSNLVHIAEDDVFVHGGTEGAHAVAKLTRV